MALVVKQRKRPLIGSFKFNGFRGRANDQEALRRPEDGAHGEAEEEGGVHHRRAGDGRRAGVEQEGGAAGGLQQRRPSPPVEHGAQHAHRQEVEGDEEGHREP